MCRCVKGLKVIDHLKAKLTVLIVYLVRVDKAVKAMLGEHYGLCRVVGLLCCGGILVPFLCSNFYTATGK